ncbi:MAG: gamma carbonic anhydrase family protein [Desulfotalea sp.]
MNIKSFCGVFPTIAEQVYVDESSVIIGDVVIGKDASIWPLVTIRGDVNSIVVGERTNIQDGSVLHVTHKDIANPEGFPLVIGNNVTVGHNCTLHGCTIKDNTLIGMGSIVLDGAVIEENVLLAAGSLVSPNKVLESGYLYRGSPAKQARKLSDEEVTSLSFSAQNYVDLKDKY